MYRFSPTDEITVYGPLAADGSLARARCERTACSIAFEHEHVPMKDLAGIFPFNVEPALHAATGPVTCYELEDT